MTFGELLSVVGERLYGLWPFRIVTDWEQGVRVFSGNATRLLTSTNGLRNKGIHWFCPIFGSILVEEANLCVVETALQTVTSLDGREATFSMGVKYRIRDLRVLYTKIHDHEDTILEQVRSSAGHAASKLNWAEMSENLGPAVEVEVKQKIRGWGLEIIGVSPINLSDAKVLRLLYENGS